MKTIDLLKKNLYMYVVCLLLSFNFVACSETTEDPNPADEIKCVSSTVNYSINISDDYFRFYDITATYNDENGDMKTTTLTENFEKQITYDYSKRPNTISFNVKGKLKSEKPGNDKEIYKFSYNSSMTVQTLKSDNNKSLDFNENSNKTIDINNEKINDYLENHAEVTFAKHIFNTEDMDENKK